MLQFREVSELVVFYIEVCQRIIFAANLGDRRLNIVAMKDLLVKGDEVMWCGWMIESASQVWLALSALLSSLFCYKTDWALVDWSTAVKLRFFQSNCLRVSVPKAHGKVVGPLLWWGFWKRVISYTWMDLRFAECITLIETMLSLSSS